MKVTVDIDQHPLAETIGAGGDKLGQRKARAYLNRVLRRMVGGEVAGFGKVAAEALTPDVSDAKVDLEGAIRRENWEEVATLTAELAALAAVRAFFDGPTDDGMKDHEHEEGI